MHVWGHTSARMYTVTKLEQCLHSAPIARSSSAAMLRRSHDTQNDARQAFVLCAVMVRAAPFSAQQRRPCRAGMCAHASVSQHTGQRGSASIARAKPAQEIPKNVSEPVATARVTTQQASHGSARRRDLLLLAGVLSTSTGITVTPGADAKDYKGDGWFDVPPATEAKTIIITGANSGIGFAASSALAAAGHNVCMVCRTAKKAEDACAQVRVRAPLRCCTLHAQPRHARGMQSCVVSVVALE